MNIIAKQTHKKGFTLVELLVVMAIIASLAAISFGVFNKLRDSAKEKETKILLQNIKSNMEAVQAETGVAYPTDVKDLVKYLTGDKDFFEAEGVKFEVRPAMPEFLENNGKTKFLKNGIIVDSWKRPIEYKSPADSSRKNNFEGGFDLKSDGRDPESTKDDLEI